MHLKKLLFAVQKRFKLKTKRNVDQRFGCILSLIMIIVWLHVNSFKTAKPDVTLQTVRLCLRNSELHKKSWHEFP